MNSTTRKYIDYPKPDTLPATAAEARTIAEYMDLVLKETQADMVERGREWLRKKNLKGAISQGQLSALRMGNEPQPCFWPIYQAALQIDDTAQFYRLMRNSAKIASLIRTDETPLLDWIEFETSKAGQLVKLRNERGAGGSDVNRGREQAHSDALDHARRAGDSKGHDAHGIRESARRADGAGAHAALVQKER